MSSLSSTLWRVLRVNTVDFESVLNDQQALGFTLHSWVLTNGGHTVILVLSALVEDMPE